MMNDPTAAHAQDTEDIAAGRMVQIDTQTQGGKILLDMTEALLAERLAVMAHDDPECKAYLKLLNEIGYQISMAAGKSAKLMQQRGLNQ